MENNTQNKDLSRNDGNTMLGEVKSDKWVFCNTKLQPYPYEWSSKRKCPKCGNHLVNIMGTCATKVYY